MPSPRTATGLVRIPRLESSASKASGATIHAPARQEARMIRSVQGEVLLPGVVARFGSGLAWFTPRVHRIEPINPPLEGLRVVIVGFKPSQ
jgi:hypothetical protein